MTRIFSRQPRGLRVLSVIAASTAAIVALSPVAEAAKAKCYKVKVVTYKTVCESSCKKGKAKPKVVKVVKVVQTKVPLTMPVTAVCSFVAGKNIEVYTTSASASPINICPNGANVANRDTSKGQVAGNNTAANGGISCSFVAGGDIKVSTGGAPINICPQGETKIVEKTTVVQQVILPGEPYCAQPAVTVKRAVYDAKTNTWTAPECVAATPGAPAPVVVNNTNNNTNTNTVTVNVQVPLPPATTTPPPTTQPPVTTVPPTTTTTTKPPVVTTTTVPSTTTTQPPVTTTTVPPTTTTTVPPTTTTMPPSTTTTTVFIAPGCQGVKVESSKPLIEEVIDAIGTKVIAVPAGSSVTFTADTVGSANVVRWERDRSVAGVFQFFKTYPGAKTLVYTFDSNGLDSGRQRWRAVIDNGVDNTPEKTPCFVVLYGSKVPAA